MKTLSALVVSIFSLSSICLFACHKNAESPYSSKYFPNDVGDTWVYNVTDSSQSTINNPSPPRHYSVKVSITGIKKLLDGKDATVWQYQYPSGNDTNYVRITGDTVKIFDNTYSRSLADLSFPRIIFLLPFQVGKSWEGKLFDVDSVRVISQANVSTVNQTFTGCYDIYHLYAGPNTSLNDYYWFKANVGMVHITKKDYEFGPTLYQSWQLESFSIH